MSNIRKIGIYKITCNVTGMSYIGQSNDLSRRLKFYKSLRCSKQPRIHRSLIKYGVINHTFTIVWESKYHANYTALQKDTLNVLEKFYIFKYNTLSPNGLNLYSGGDSYTASEETRLKLSINKSGIKHPMYGKTGKLNPSSKSVIQLTKNGTFIKEWESATEAEKSLGISKDSVSACCRGNRFSTGGYIWMLKTDYDINGSKVYKLPKRKETLSKKTYQYDLNGNYIKEWNSTMDIERNLHITNTTISRVCTENRGQSGGYQWRYFKNFNGIPPYINNSKSIIVENIDSGLVQEFVGLNKLAKFLHVRSSTIKRCCESHDNRYKNYKFTYKY